MKKHLILFFSVAVIGTCSLNAQIQVKSNGRALIGAADAALLAADTANLIPLRVMGVDTLISGQKKTPARIAFGDSPSSVYVGEHQWNSNRLHIHGDGAIYASVKENGGEWSLFSYDTLNPMKIFFISADQTSVKKLYYTSLVQPSDRRFKKNIRSLEATMDKLSQLQGVTYQLDASESPLYNSQYAQQENKPSGVPLSARTAAVEDTTKHIGFIAQELQKVFPELVTTDNEGNLYVDYVSLIPVIVEALKEQQTINDAQSVEIAELRETIAQMQISPKSRQAGTPSDALELKAFLRQNSPNPFGEVTQISYYLPQDAQNASICIFNLQGTLLKNYPLESLGDGTLEIQAADLQPGMYIYSLLVGNQEKDTKRMVVTR